MNFLDFEQPIEELHKQIEHLQHGRHLTKPKHTASELETKLRETQIDIYSRLTTWQRIQVSRHPDRPYTLYYIDQIATKFIELFGDRSFRDDKAIVGGFGELNGETVMFIGHQKGVNTKMRQFRNFGMPNPEGYRKALRLMKLAEKFNKPVVTLIDTPGAYPGEEAEQRGQGEAIARNLFEMVSLKVPLLCIVIGEGASGGALGIGIGDKLLMLENTWYSVISPESCSSSPLAQLGVQGESSRRTQAHSAGPAIQLGIIDGIIPEPPGGAHSAPEETASNLKAAIVAHLAELKKLSPEERINKRIARYSGIGIYHTDPA